MNLLIEKLGNISSIMDAISFYLACKGYSEIIDSISQLLALVVIIYSFFKLVLMFISSLND